MESEMKCDLSKLKNEYFDDFDLVDKIKSCLCVQIEYIKGTHISNLEHLLQEIEMLVQDLRIAKNYIINNTIELDEEE